jgi:ATP-binding protein involved in chromosome partitioning
MTGAPLVGSVPIEPAVSAGGDTGKPAVLAAPESEAARAFDAIAEQIVTSLLPPVEMASCTARIFELVQQKPA